MFVIPIYLTSLIIILLFTGFFFAEALKRFCPGFEGWEVPLAFGVAVVFFVLRYTNYPHHKIVAFTFIGAVFLVSLILKIIEICRACGEEDEDGEF